MTFLVSFIDEAFDSRSFHFDCQDSIKTFFLSHGLEELDKELDSASEKVLLFNELIAVLCKLKQFPIIKYFDPTKTGTNVAARFAWKLLVKAQGLIEERESWPKQNQDVDVIIMDRNHDSITPLIHSLCYRSAIHDLLTVKDGNKVFLLPGDEKPFVLDESDPYFVIWFYIDSIATHVP
jgi:hypothetical protein